MSSVYKPNSQFEAKFDPKRCAASVSQGDRGFSYGQCVRKGVLTEEGHLWCKQHAPSTEAARRAKRDQRWAAQSAASDRKYQLRELGDKIVAEACRMVTDDVMHMQASNLHNLVLRYQKLKARG